MKELVVILKRDGEIVEANKAFLEFFKGKKEELIGKNSNDIMPLKILSESIIKCKFDRVEKSEQISFGEHVLNATITPVMVNDGLNFISITLRDISAFVQLERALLKRNKELGIINTLSSTFISSGDINSVFADLLEKVLIVSDFSLGWIVMKEGESFVLRNMSGASLELRHELEKGELNALYDNVVELTDPLYVLESGETERIEVLKREGVVFFACIPLRVGPETIGILVLASRVEIKFDFDTAAVFSLIGNNISLIAEKIKLFQETQRLALTDGLTGLYNVRFFYDMLNKEIARSKRYHTLFSLILFDIDDFKIINDTHGHQAGDDVLRSVASTLKTVSRETDIVVRYGGEEFILMLPSTPKHEALTLADRIREKVEEYRYLGEETVKITMSGGVATFPEDAEDSKALLYAADMAMYEAKGKGKKQVCCYRRIHETSI
ncbi:MAG: diguanylate cyclase [Thermodesulfovibrionales bacterium]|nr:diguanylate cyclase [Thermodesulfovibrionales bacterium]